MLNKKNNRDELTDADILKEVSFEENPTDTTEIAVNKSSEERVIANDFVDSSLFVADDFQKEDRVRNKDKDLNPDTKDNKMQFSAQMNKNADIRKPEAINSEPIGNRYSEKMEVLPTIDENIIVIKAGKRDSASNFKWKMAGSILILLIIGSASYIFLNNRKEEKTAIKQEESIDRSNKELTQTADISAEENGVESEEKLTAPSKDFLKIKIEVFNASGVAGAAGKIKDFLASNKYENVEAKNYSQDNMSGIIVFYKEDGLKDAAQKIVDILKTNNTKSEIKLALSNKEIEGDVAIILGK
ncbi:MAG: hypothetical protein UR82_C0044G0002 [Candidatus Moranbacteria bacterium GW2011_GWF1_35_5]|nr:MAG: hypothetical protein UR82_C0044G0002 [Candidatus Moranbacteria bacterium GW2011_GWF1_35_5]